MEVDSKPNSDLTSSKLTFWPLQKDCHVVQTLSMCFFEFDAKHSALQTKLNEINFNTAKFYRLHTWTCRMLIRSHEE